VSSYWTDQYGNSKPIDTAEAAAQQQLDALRLEGERQIAQLQLTRAEVARLRIQAEQQLGNANTQQLGQLRGEVAQLKAQIDRLKEDREVFSAQARSAQSEVTVRDQTIKQLTGKLEEATQVVVQLTDKVKDMQRLVPDPNDARDWSGDPFWFDKPEPQLQPLVPVLGTASVVPADELSELPESGDSKHDRFKWMQIAGKVFDYPLAQVGVMAIGSGGIYVAHLLHWMG
jgi:outer membrane murein-binding lipoprotein Lpp